MKDCTETKCKIALYEVCSCDCGGLSHGSERFQWYRNLLDGGAWDNLVFRKLEVIYKPK